MNRIYRVDGGFSRGFKIWSHNNLVQVLEITDDINFKILSDPGSTDISKIPDINISDTYVNTVAKIYSQDRINSTDADLDLNLDSDFEFAKSLKIKSKRSKAKSHKSYKSYKSYKSHKSTKIY